MTVAIFLGAGASAAEGAPTQTQLFRAYFKSVRAQGAPAGASEMHRELATFFVKFFNIDVE
jgi:hypothetical protein